MKRTSIVLLWLIVLTSIVDPVNQNFVEDDPNNTANVVTLANNECEEVNDDVFCDREGVVGLFEGIPTTEEVYALVVFIAFFIGIPSYLLFRYLYRICKRRIYHKGLENKVDEEFVEDSRNLGGHLPVTEKELFEFRVKEIKKRRRKKYLLEENKTVPITVKEELVLLSVFLFVIYLFWNNGL
jgi:hypothetical protein